MKQGRGVPGYRVRDDAGDYVTALDERGWPTWHYSRAIRDGRAPAPTPMPHDQALDLLRRMRKRAKSDKICAEYHLVRVTRPVKS
jgi:hypothetical protein